MPVWEAQVDELQKTRNFALVRQIFETVLSETEYLEAPEGCKGIAAEMIAASLSTSLVETYQLSQAPATRDWWRVCGDGLIALASN